MVGRLDDWLKVVADKLDISVDPGVWNGRACGLQEDVSHLRGTAVPHPAALGRIPEPHALERAHRRECGDLPAYKWQVRFNASDVPVVPRIDIPVDPGVVASLLKFADFRRAYAEDGLSPAEFASFPPTRRTLRQFIAACHELDGQVREILIPNPDEAKVTA